MFSFLLLDNKELFFPFAQKKRKHNSTPTPQSHPTQPLGSPVLTLTPELPLNPSRPRRRRHRPPQPSTPSPLQTPYASAAMDAATDGEQRRLLSIPKEGERVIAPTRRPDGTLRKEIRIRAGYVPQDEVAIYQSKGALVSPRSIPRTLFPHHGTKPVPLLGSCSFWGGLSLFVLGADEEVRARRDAGVRPCARCQAQDEGGQAQRAAQGETAPGRPSALVNVHHCPLMLQNILIRLNWHGYMWVYCPRAALTFVRSLVEIYMR